MILNLKAMHPAMTDALADDIIGTFKQMLQQNCLPSSLYEVKKFTTQLGLTFDNIDGCPNGCVLYDQDHTRLRDSCPVCLHPRCGDMERKTRPLKVLRHFHLIPHLQRMFRTPTLSKLMRWHYENKSSDGKVRFPADSHLENIPPAEFDTNGFGQQKQDVHLKVSVDGVCPFKLHKSTWSAWPVLISFLNLPP